LQVCERAYDTVSDTAPVRQEFLELRNRRARVSLHQVGLTTKMTSTSARLL
jgi:hypothetical protein